MNRERLTESIKRHEGYRRIPYKDHLGYWTVGYGRLLENHHVDGRLGDILEVLTNTQTHEDWLEEDIDDAVEIAEDFLGPAWSKLSPARQEVVAEMAYQMGNRVRQFLKFREAVINNYWDGAVAQMRDSRWYRQTPVRAETLAIKFLSQP